MKKKRKPFSAFLNVLTVVFFLLCIALLFYPYISNHIMYARQYEKIVSYDDRAVKMDEEMKQSYLSAAREYNKRLLGNKIGYQLSDEQMDEYNSLLSYNDDHAMGYLTIPKIDVNLLIYHTVDESCLSSGVGHLPGSSLPVGGKGTNAVIMGHSGLTSATLFTNLDRLEIGDRFFIGILGDKLAYEIDSISVVEPEKLNDIAIDPEEDFCTLVTCTPYGVNSHRLVMRGRRIPYDAGEDSTGSGVKYYKIRVPDIDGPPDFSEILAMLGTAILLAGVITVIIKRIKRKNIQTEEKKMKRIISAMLTALMLVLVLSVITAGALDADSGVSLTLHYIADSNPMEGVSFSVWQIALTDAEGTEKAKEPFDIEGVSDMTAEELSALSRELDVFVKEKSLAPDDTAVTNQQGTLTFEKATDKGVYYVTGESKTVGDYIYTPTPFIIALPYTDEYGRLIKQVEANVKYEKTTPPTEPATQPGTEPSTEPPTVPATAPSPTAPTPTTPTSNIPQTGTIFWLVPLLAVAGALLVAVGFVIRKKSSK